MTGLKVGTILSIMQYRFIVDSTDADGNSFLKQIGAVPNPVRDNLKEQIRDDINIENYKSKKKDKKIIKTLNELEGEKSDG